MRIAVVNNFFPPRAGGSSHIADTLAVRYAHQGHEVIVITAAYAGAPDYEERDGLKIFRLPSWTLPESKFSFNFDITFALKWGNRKKVWKLLDDFAPDVVHQHGQFFDLTWQSGFWARSRRTPSVLTLHTRLVSPGKLTGTIFRLLDALIVNPILKLTKPNKIVAIDKTFLEYSRARYGVTEKNGCYIPIGIEVEPFLELDLGQIQKDSHSIVSLGHVIPLRDRVMLVRSMPKVLKAIPDAKLRVLGGIYYDEFLNVAKNLNVESAIDCLGAVKKVDVPRLLNESAVEIHDLQGFGIGIASLEAMACGLPVVIAADLDYFPHAPFIDRKHVWHVDVDDDASLSEAIIELLSNPRLASEIGAAGRNYVLENFDINQVATQYLDLFANVSKDRASS